MKATTWILGGFALVVAAAPLGAQEGRGARGPGRAAGMVGFDRIVAVALDGRERLALTDRQVGELEALAASARDALAPLEEEVEALRARNRDREESPTAEERVRMREEARALVQRVRVARVPYQKRLEDILTDGQRRQLGAMVRPGRGRRGGGDGMRGMRGGRGGRGGPDFGRGGRRGPGGRGSGFGVSRPDQGEGAPLRPHG